MRSVLSQFICAGIFFLASSNLFSQRDENGRDRTQSPYFELPGKRGEKETLPLLSTSADAVIAGVIADVKVTQVYVNRGKTPIEASYIFPLSTRAAVYQMQFVLGKRIVKAKVDEKDKALQTYNDAKAEGKTASLLQQHRPNVFQMNLANIMPGDTIKVELIYTELLLNEDGVYEFVYPTVVGPRYTEDLTVENTPTEKWVGTPYSLEKVKPAYLFNIKAKLNAGMPIQDISCTSHEVDVTYNGTSTAQISLKGSDKFSGNKDFILNYRLAGNKVQEGVLFYEAPRDEPGAGPQTNSLPRENYFLMMLQPPKTVTTKDLPGREYIFIMDVSGSQSGFPLEISKELMKNLFTDLREEDKFNVMVFEGYAGFMSETSLEATEENIKKAVEYVNGQRGSGSTNLMGALKKAMTFPRTKNYSRTFAIATDGYVSIEKDAFQYVKDNLGDANFFTFGIGSSVNRFIIEGMAHAGMAEPMFVTKPNEASAAAEKFRKYISNPVLTNIKVSFDGFAAYDIVPQNVPDVFAQRPIIVFGKYKGSPSGSIKVTGINASGNYSVSMDLSSQKGEKENTALKYLWARQKIRGYEFAGKIGNQVKNEITKLGLDYGLLTEYTSFVAVDSEIRNKGGKADSVVQTLPLPEGVSNLALGTKGVAGKAKTTYQTTNNNAGNATGYNYSTNTGAGLVTNAPATTQYKVVSKTNESQVALKSEYAKSADKKEIRTQNKQSVEVQKSTASGKKDQANKVVHTTNGCASADVVVKEPEVKQLGEVVVEKQQPLCYVEQMPSYPGGESVMQKYLIASINYPKSCQDAEISGTVYVQFVVDADGTIKDIKILKSPHKDLSEEAMRVIKAMPKWNPGKSNGKAVKVQYNLPVKFSLNK
jgi:Ca-activated chloride channel homolog